MEINYEVCLKLVLAVVIGGIIGIEREMRSKSAGFRTLMLICVGATLYGILSQLIGVHTSPDRIASNVVVGIGFLGAGVIFRGENRASGITTAASIWVTAALGVCIGAGYYLVAMFGCALVIMILFIFSFFDRVIDKINQVREYKITYPYEEHEQHKYEDLIEKFGLVIKSRSQNKAGNIIKGYWAVKGSEKKHHAFIEHILQDASVTEFDF